MALTRRLMEIPFCWVVAILPPLETDSMNAYGSIENHSPQDQDIHMQGTSVFLYMKICKTKQNIFPQLLTTVFKGDFVVYEELLSTVPVLPITLKAWQCYLACLHVSLFLSATLIFTVE